MKFHYLWFSLHLSKPIIIVDFHHWPSLNYGKHIKKTFFDSQYCHSVFTQSPDKTDKQIKQNKQLKCTVKLTAFPSIYILNLGRKKNEKLVITRKLQKGLWAGTSSLWKLCYSVWGVTTHPTPPFILVSCDNVSFFSF